MRDYVCLGVARSGAGRHRLSAYLGTQELSASGTTADTKELCSSPVQLRQKSHATAPLMELQCEIFSRIFFKVQMNQVKFCDTISKNLPSLWLHGQCVLQVLSKHDVRYFYFP